MPSGEEIQRALRGFVDTWRDYAGSEKSEAQTFLNQLFACYGSDRREVGAQFEYFARAAGFIDLLWPGICIVEMKAPVSVETAQRRVEGYWRDSGNFDEDVPAARFIVICNLRQFEIWDFARHPNRPRATIELADLPDLYEALAFLAGSAERRTALLSVSAPLWSGPTRSRRTSADPRHSTTSWRRLEFSPTPSPLPEVAGGRQGAREHRERCSD